MFYGTVSFSHKKVAGWSLFWQAGAPDVVFAGLRVAFCFVFEGEFSAVPNVRLLFGLCCCNRKFNGVGFFPPFHSIVLIRKVGFSLSDLAREKKQQLPFPVLTVVIW